MIIYEVTAKVGDHLSNEYERYMIGEHIPDVLRSGAFTSASFLLGPDGQYQARYAAQSREALDRYLQESAPLLRQAVLDRFPQGVDLGRREWDLIRTWKC